MLAYAAHRPVPIDRRPHPNTMLLIIGAHGDKSTPADGDAL